MKRIIPALLLWVIYPLWSEGGIPVDAYLSGSTALASVQKSKFSAGFQFAKAIQGGLSIQFLPNFSLVVIGGMHSTDASSLNQGVSYRGFSGYQGGIEFQGRTLLIREGFGALPESFQLWGGIGIGGSAFFSRYHHTSIYFFYPGALAELFFDAVPSSRSSWRIRASVPAQWFFRRDLEFAYNVGFSLSLMYNVNGAAHQTEKSG